MQLLRFYFGKTRTEITMKMGDVLERRVRKMYGIALGGAFFGLMLTERTK
jgi:hypothetical protein